MSDIPTTAGIYCILNEITGKIYIGSAVNFRERKNGHFSALARCCHRNRHLQSSFNKHGLDAFSFHVVEFVNDKSLLIKREQFYIDETQCCDRDKGYNLSPTAGSQLGVKLSDEARAKMSKAQSGEKHPLWGKKHSAETRAKMSIAKCGEKHPMWGKLGTMLGKTHSEESRANMSAAQLRWRHAERDVLQLLLF